jgi:hypothetical protein
MSLVFSLYRESLQNRRRETAFAKDGFAFHFNYTNIVRLVDETYKDQEEDGRTRKNIRGRKRPLA